jgi:hypothetical protein
MRFQLSCDDAVTAPEAHFRRGEAPSSAQQHQYDTVTT